MTSFGAPECEGYQADPKQLPGVKDEGFFIFSSGRDHLSLARLLPVPHSEAGFMVLEQCRKGTGAKDAHPSG